MAAAMDFLRDLLAQLKVRRTIDWTWVEAAQRAFERGETKPFHGLAAC